MTLQAEPGEGTTTTELGCAERRLVERFCPPLREADVNRCLMEAWLALADAPVRRFVPILAERLARERLRALADPGRRTG
jgi:hypothetical protein